MSSDLLTIYTDGACRGNPGPSAIAYTISRDGHEPIEVSECLGKATNNIAEYTALIRALEHALELGPNLRVVLHSDSELMVKQMNGEYAVKNAELKELYNEAIALCKQFDRRPEIRHVRREQNKRADELGNEALDGHPRPHIAGLTAAAPAPVAPPRPKQPTLHEHAVEILREFGGDDGARETWGRLVRLLEEAGIRVPRNE